jgi:DNA repair exonuclease SbcCD ATPase subunit
MIAHVAAKIHGIGDGVSILFMQASGTPVSMSSLHARNAVIHMKNNVKGGDGMSDKERLEHIEEKVQGLLTLADSEGYGEAHLLTIYNDMIWLIEQAEKVEHLEQEAEEEIGRLEKRYEFVLQIENELRQEVQQLQQQLHQVRESISDALDLLKRGGVGTRSQVKQLLEKALEVTE